MSFDHADLCTHYTAHFYARYRTPMYPILFANLTGSRAFGCHTPDSDYDVCAVHVRPLEEALGFHQPHEVIEMKMEVEGKFVESVSMELKKFLLLLLKSNGNVLETLYSPYTVLASPELHILRHLASGCITKMCANHYIGMAHSQQRGLKNRPVKSLFHAARCLLMGRELMRTGHLEMQILPLAHRYECEWLIDLIRIKRMGDDLTADEIAGYQSHIEQHHQLLLADQAQSSLPEKPTQETQDALERFLIERRKRGD